MSWVARHAAGVDRGETIDGSAWLARCAYPGEAGDRKSGSCAGRSWVD